MDIGSLYSDYLTTSAPRTDDLERKIKSSDGKKNDEELLDACKQFEAYFYEQVFKNMEKAMVPSDTEDVNHTLIDYYKENLIAEYSKDIVEQGGNGSNTLAQQLYEQMKRNYSA